MVVGVVLQGSENVTHKLTTKPKVAAQESSAHNNTCLFNYNYHYCSTKTGRASENQIR